MVEQKSASQQTSNKQKEKKMFKRKGVMSLKELTDNVNLLLSRMDQLKIIVENNQQSLAQVTNIVKAIIGNEGGTNENSNY